MNKIEEALSKLFNEYRVIFWNDEKKELLEQFNELFRWCGFAIRAPQILDLQSVPLRLIPKTAFA